MAHSRHIYALILALSLPSYGASVKLVGGVTASCDYGFASADKSGNWTFICKATKVQTPQGSQDAAGKKSSATRPPAPSVAEPKPAKQP